MTVIIAATMAANAAMTDNAAPMAVITATGMVTTPTAARIVTTARTAAHEERPHEAARCQGRFRAAAVDGS